MKPSKIYIKIFFSFLLILIVTEILIFALFGIIMGRYFRSEFNHYASVQAMLVKEVIDSKIKTSPGVDLSGNEPLKAFIRDLGESLGAQVWLQGPEGRVVAKSFSGAPPSEPTKLLSGQWRDFGHFRLYHGRKRGPALYAVIPITLEAEKSAELHVLFDKREPVHPEEGFGWGLAIIGVVTSLVSAYYYLRVVVTMYMKDGEPETERETWLGLTTGVTPKMSVIRASPSLGSFPSPRRIRPTFVSSVVSMYTRVAMNSIPTSLSVANPRRLIM